MLYVLHIPTGLLTQFVSPAVTKESALSIIEEADFFLSKSTLDKSYDIFAYTWYKHVTPAHVNRSRYYIPKIELELVEY